MAATSDQGQRHDQHDEPKWQGRCDGRGLERAACRSRLFDELVDRREVYQLQRPLIRDVNIFLKVALITI